MLKTIKIIFASTLIIVSLAFFIYPAVTIGFLTVDSKLNSTGQSWMLPRWFETTSHKYTTWAEEYLRTGYATKVNKYNVAATEWPLFGSVFFLLTAKALQEQNSIDVLHGENRIAIDYAAKILASESSATWVKKRWKKRYFKTGITYLEKDNVFYRMLFIRGLSAYEKITQNRRYHTQMIHQARTLAQELIDAKYHIADDYPALCYPVDVLWALKAIQEADSIEALGVDIKGLTTSLVNSLEAMSSKDILLPPFQADSKSGISLQEAKGSGTSSLFPFMLTLDDQAAQRWYAVYTEHFWQATPWYSGFREFPRGASAFEDVDSGPIIHGIGSVASIFGIGASKSMGRLDQAVPLTLEVVAFSWPTPFGFLIPSLGTKVLADSWVLGDTGLLYTMTRSVYSDTIMPFKHTAPLIVWTAMLVFLVIGGILLYLGFQLLYYPKNQQRRKHNVYK